MSGLKAFTLTLIYKTKRFFSKALLFSFISSILGGLGIMMLIPLMGMVGLQSTSLSPLLEPLSHLWDYFSPENRLIAILGLFVLINLVSALASREAEITTFEVAQHFTAILKNQLHESLIQAPYESITGIRKEDMIHLFTVEISRLANAGLMAVRFITTTVTLVVTIGFSLSVSWPFTLLVVGGAAVLTILLFPLIKRFKGIGFGNLKVLRTLNQDLHDQLYGYKEIKNYGTEDLSITRFKNLSTRIVDQFMLFHKTTSNVDLLYKLSASLLIAIYTLIAVKFMGLELASMAVLVVLFSRLWPLTTNLQKTYQELILLIPSYQLYQESMNRFAHKDLSPKPIESTQRPFTRSLHLHQAQFNYQAQSNFGIEVDTTINKGEITVIVGSSGSGKTTLADVLSGLLPLKQGHLEIDGIDVLTYGLASYRRLFAVVEAEAYVAHASIRENLSLYSNEIDEKDLWDALDRAQLSEVIRSFPLGLDMIVGDDGILLSSGERQRLLLARALLHHPKILILDEATNALDGANERRFHEVLVSLKQEMTIILIAHRESAMRLADQILVMNKGHLVESGSYRQLKADPYSKFNQILGSQS
jgi:ATP-binding cassette subfamily C protein